MQEEDIRTKLDRVDKLRERAATLDKIARWPTLPSEVRVDKTRGILRSIWKGIDTTVMGEVALTNEERRELAEWLSERAAKLRADANRIVAELES